MKEKLKPVAEPVALTRTQVTIDAVRQLIIDGDFKPGDRLQAQRVADRLQVSRTPVADALGALHQEGLLEYEPRCGYTVKSFDLQMLLASFDVRSTLEGLACRLVAEKGLASAPRAAIEANLNEAERALFGAGWGHDEQDSWRVLNREFHDTLISAANNPYLTSGVATTRLPSLIFDQSRRGIRSEDIQRQFERTKSQQAFRDHVRIIDAIVARQAWRAEAMMKEHIYTNREATRVALESAITS